MEYELYHGDCLEIMATMPSDSVDAVIADPPYDKRTHIGARYGFRKTSSEIDFSWLSDVSFVSDMIRVSRGWVLCFCSFEMFGTYQAAAEDSWVRAGIWRKPNGVPQFTGDRPGQCGEGISIMHSPATTKRWNSNGKHGFWEHCIASTNRVHQTQKPIHLMEELIEDFTNPGDTIFDPFMGSGTTGVACAQTGRNFIGIEIDAGYYDIARRRIANAYGDIVQTTQDVQKGQLTLFEQVTA